MTYKEAIRRITKHSRIHQRKEPRAVYITEALQTALEALEKQIPIKIVTKGHCEFCPNCNTELIYLDDYYVTTYCCKCGQALFFGRVIQNDR